MLNMEQQYQGKTRYIVQAQRFQYHPATITTELRNYGNTEIRKYGGTGKMMPMKDKKKNHNLRAEKE